MKNNLLVTLADAGYIDQAKQLFSSAYHNAGWKGDYMLLAHEIPDGELEWFRRKGILVRKCKPLLEDMDGVGGLRRPITVCSKFYLFTREFTEWEKIIFCDADIIIRHSLDGLLGLKGFWAAPDCAETKIKDHLVRNARSGRGIDGKHFRRLSREVREKFDISEASFNSGFFVLDTSIITDDMLDGLKHMLARYERISRLGEQPVMNLFFSGRWRPLPPAYNVYINNDSICDRRAKHIDSRHTDGVVLHFNLSKPWKNGGYFYEEWKRNLERADMINLGKIPAGSKFPGLKIRYYYTYLWMHSLPPRLIMRADRMLGMFGVFLRRHLPSISSALLPPKNGGGRDRPPPGPHDFESLVRLHASGSKDFFFIQIGANEGRINDPIYHFVRSLGWKGLLVEPQKECFEKLRENYRGCNGLSFENAAVSGSDGRRTLYKISFSKERWATGLASFRKDVAESHIRSEYVRECAEKEGAQVPERVKDCLAEESVRTVTFESLLKSHPFERIDLLQIDAEGYDYEIIKLFDFGKTKPVIIHYENENLSESDKDGCRAQLKNLGYDVIDCRHNSVAFLPEILTTGGSQ